MITLFYLLSLYFLPVDPIATTFSYIITIHLYHFFTVLELKKEKRIAEAAAAEKEREREEEDE